MKKFEVPEIKIEAFAIEDVVTTSNPGAWDDETDERG